MGARGDLEGGTYSGAAYIFLGRSNWNSVIDAWYADAKLNGKEAYDQVGVSISSAGDVNNDGIDDVIVGASRDDDGGIDSGCAFIYFGRQNWNRRIDAENADVKLIGEDYGDHFGNTVSSGK